VGGRRMINVRLTLAVCSAAAAAVATAPAAEDLAARAARLHQAAIVADTHEDVPEDMAEKWGAYANWHDIGEPGATKEVDIPRLKQGGVTAPFFAVYVPASYAESGGSARYALELSDLIDGMVARHPGELVARPRWPTSGGPRPRAASRSSRASRAAMPSRTPWGPCAGSTGSASAT